MTQIGDSAWALTGRYPGGVDGWGFYIGGDTPHVWSDAELAALPGRYRLPIYTRSYPNGAAQAQTDAAAAIAWARAHQQPAGTLIQLDFETAVDRAYVLAFDAAITAAGFKTVLYGSQSTVLLNPQPSGGYNIARWDGLDEDPSWTAKQYIDMGAYDLNDFSPTAPLWDTQPPAAAPAPMEDDMKDYVFYIPAGPSGGGGYAVLLAGKYLVLPDGTDVQGFQAQLPTITIDQPMHDLLTKTYGPAA